MKNIKTIIFDLDGTLYFQYGVQCFMGCQMIIYYLFHFWRWKELMAILNYRKIREQNIENIVKEQYIIISKKYNMSVEQVENLIRKWMFQKPLKAINLFKDRKLCRLINKLKEEGMNIIIYSDYPTEEKLKALNIQYDKAYDSTHSQINTLKPDPKGLQYIIKSNKLKEDEILFVGDRDSKDGQCARNCRVEYIILPKCFRKKKCLEIEKKVREN